MTVHNCDACGLLSASEPARIIRTANGCLHLCPQCLGDINRKSPLLAAMATQRDELLRVLQDLLHYHIGAQKDGEFSTIAAARAAVARCKEAK